MGSETLPSAFYILSDESSIPFYFTSNGYNKFPDLDLITINISNTIKILQKQALHIYLNLYQVKFHAQAASSLNSEHVTEFIFISIHCN